MILFIGDQNGEEKGGFETDHQLIQDELEAAGYHTQYYHDSQVVLDFFSGDYLMNYGIVMIRTHGGLSNINRFNNSLPPQYRRVIGTGTNATYSSNLANTIKYLSRSGMGGFLINYDWLDATTSPDNSFPNSIVYIASCHSYEDSDTLPFDEIDIPQYFRNHKASVYAGLKGSSPLLCSDFCENL